MSFGYPIDQSDLRRITAKGWLTHLDLGLVRRRGLVR